MAGKEYAFYDRKALLAQQNTLALGGLTILGSLLFWIVMFYIGYQGVFYGRMYLRISEEADFAEACNDGFSSREENLRRVMDYPHGDAWPYIQRFNSEKLAQSSSFPLPTEGDEFPPLVTVVSSRTFFQVQSLIRHYREDMLPKYPRLKLVLFDLGLYKSELDIMKKHCSCSVRQIEYSLYPSHVADLNNQAWRPLIIQLALEEFGSVMYIDPTSRFKPTASLNILKNRGQRTFFVWDVPVFKSIIAYTNPATFKFLNEKRCAFRESGLVDVSFLIAFKSNATWQLLMKPWLKCALNQECLEPAHSTHSYCFSMRHPKTTGCHRYDQSALSITVNRAIQLTLKRDQYVPSRLTEEAEPHLQGEAYFEEQPWTNTQIILILVTPIMLYVIYKLLRKYKKSSWRKI